MRLFLFEFLFFGGDIGLRRTDLAGEGLASGHDEPGLFLVRPDDGKRILFGPFRLELLGRKHVEVDGNPRVGKLLQALGIELAPDLQVVDLFLQVLNGLRIIGITHEHAAGEADDVTVDGLGLDALRQLDLLQAADQAGDEIHVPHHFMGVVVGRLHAAGDVHEADLLEFLQKTVLLSVQEDERVFGHGSDHTSEASSSSAAWRCLTIFWDALERFSSSSMYRLILRMASW